MKEVWLDEEANEFRLVGKSFWPKKILQQCTMLWHNIKGGIKNTVSRIFHKYLPFILVLLLSILLLFFLLKANGTRYPFGSNVNAITVPNKEDNAKAVPKNLTVATLLEARESKPFCEAMDNCFDRAIKEFILEPQILKENAKMILQCNGTRKEFVSGKGENYIEVFWIQGQTHYTVKEANSQVYVARLELKPLPLNLGSLLNVYQRLASLDGSEVLRQCLNKTIEKFPKQLQAVQDNATLRVTCGGSNVTFISEAGQNEINVYKDMQGEIVFNLKAKGGAWWAIFFRKPFIKE